MNKHAPPWLPDWRDPDQYPATEASPQEWAWEFLRRNHLYWAAYDNYLSLREMIVESDPDILEALRSSKARKYISPIEFLMKDPVGQTYLQITPEISDCCLCIQQEFGIQSIGYPPDPAESYDIAVPRFTVPGVSYYSPIAKKRLSIRGSEADVFLPKLFRAPDGTLLKQNKEEWTNRLPTAPTEVIVVYDLQYNYEAQLDITKDLLRRNKQSLAHLGIGKRITKPRINSDILMMYDADLQGVPHLEIANIVIGRFTTKKLTKTEIHSRVSKQLKLARAYIERDYLRLASI